MSSFSIRTPHWPIPSAVPAPLTLWTGASLVSRSVGCDSVISTGEHAISRTPSRRRNPDGAGPTTDVGCEYKGEGGEKSKRDGYLDHQVSIECQLPLLIPYLQSQTKSWPPALSSTTRRLPCLRSRTPMRRAASSPTVSEPRASTPPCTRSSSPTPSSPRRFPGRRCGRPRTTLTSRTSGRTPSRMRRSRS